MIFIWVVAHGGGFNTKRNSFDYGRNDTSGDEMKEHNVDGFDIGVDECMKIWPYEGEDAYYWDDEVKDDLSNLHYVRLIFVFSKCYGGGFIDDLSATRRIVISAANETSEAWTIPGAEEGYWAREFINALDKDHPEQQWQDADGDGRISTYEAYVWAWFNDPIRVDPQWSEYDETPWLDDNSDGLPAFANGSDHPSGLERNCGLGPNDGTFARYTWLSPSEYNGLREDLEDNGKVDIYDLVRISKIFGYVPGNSSWDSLADTVQDNLIDIFDIVQVGLHFGEEPASPKYQSSPSSTNTKEQTERGIDGTTVISVYPNQIVTHEHETFSVDVAINDVTNLYGWEFKLYWNNSLLNCVGVQIHIPEIWSQNTFVAGSGTENSFNSTHGRFWKALAAMNPTPAFNGSMTIATLTFEAKAVGTTMLGFQETKLCDTQANAISHSASDGSVTVLPPPRFMRGDIQIVNGLTAYQLGTAQSSIQKSYGQTRSGYLSASWGIRVWKRNVSGSETELSSGIIAQVARSDEGEGLQSATWTCPQTSLAPTDSLVVRVYQKIGSDSWQLAATFTTEQSDSTQLVGTTWTITYYTRLFWTEEPPLKTSASFCWGTTTYNSRVENLEIA